jgi:hypothetical protein
VVLPSTPPQVEPGRGLKAPLRGWLGALRPALRLTPAWGAGVMAAAGIIAVVLVAHGHGGGNSGTASTAMTDSQSQQLTQGAGNGAAAPDIQKRSAIGVGACPLPQAVVTAQPGAAAADPPGFANRIAVGNPQRPGQQLVLATTGSHYAPGSQVLVYAALTTPSVQHTTVIPCVTLHDQGAVAFLPVPSNVGGGNGPGATQWSADSAASSTNSKSSGSGGAGAGAASPGSTASSAQHAAGAQAMAPPAASLLSPQQYQAFFPYTLLPPLAVAAPTAAAVANLPLQVLQIPANITPGTQLRLVALIPSGFPGSNDSPAIEAVLTLDVS